MRYFLLNLVLIIFSFNSSGQNLQRSTEQCSCEDAFTDLIEKLESNYIALAQKRLAGSDKAYEARKIHYSEKSVKVAAENCTALLDDFLSFFDDGHLFAFELPNYSEAEVSQFKEEIKKRKVSRNRLDQMILNDSVSARSASDKILGKWTDGKSDFIVIKDKDVYKAYILESTVEGVDFGEIKAIFSPASDGYFIEYNSYNYSKRYVRGDVYKEGLIFRGGSVFWTRKEHPLGRELTLIDKTNFKAPSIIKLDEKNTLISLLSFSLDFKFFDDFIKENKSLIVNSETLIIDIRGNRGGNGVYFPLIELYATQNMKGSQGLVLASKDNLSYFERKKFFKKVYKPLVQRIKNNLGEIVDGPLYPEKKFKISKKSKIKNVAILTDEGSASAAESFILHSKRSSTKVKTFGAPTEGMIDYTSVNLLLLNGGRQYIYFGYPTSTFNKEIPNNGYNKTGIVPDVAIQNDVIDEIDFIIKYYQE